MKLLVIGAGGYFKSFLDSIHPSQFEIVGLIDDRFPQMQEWFGYFVLGNLENIQEILQTTNTNNVFITIGDSKKRKEIFLKLAKLNLNFPNIIDKSANVSRNARLGKGNFIGKNTIINNDVEIGDFCVINSGAIVEHGTKIGNNCNLSPACVVNGQVEINDNVYIGSNATIIQCLKIGSNAIIGAGSVIIRDVPNDCTVVGNPGRIIKQ